MPRNRKSPEDRRQEILAAARRLFQVRGYEQTTIDDLLAELGLSKGGFYHHFRSRDEILIELTRAETVDLVDKLRASARTPGDAARRLVGLFRAGSDLTAPGDSIYRCLASAEARGLYYRALEAELQQPLRGLVADLLEQGAREGSFAPVDSVAAAEMVVAVNTHGNRRFLEGDWGPAELAAYSSFALRSLALMLGLPGLFDEILAEMNTFVASSSTGGNKQ